MVALLLPFGLLGGSRGGLGATRINPSADSNLEDRKSKASHGELYGPMCRGLSGEYGGIISGVGVIVCGVEMMKVSADMQVSQFDQILES